MAPVPAVWRANSCIVDIKHHRGEFEQLGRGRASSSGVGRRWDMRTATLDEV